MKDAAPQVIYLKDYQQPPYWIESVDLVFELDEEQTRVTSTLVLKSNKNIQGQSPLVLDGEKLVLEAIRLNGSTLESSRYKITDTELVVDLVPEEFTLEIVTIIKPQENFSLEGFYKSSGNYCTQCESEGFRKIT